VIEVTLADSVTYTFEQGKYFINFLEEHNTFALLSSGLYF